MELKAYLAILQRRKWVIIITTAVTLIVAVVGTLMLTPEYVASATLRVPLSTGVAGDAVRSTDLLYADRLMTTYEQIATSQPILQELARKLGRDTPPEVDVALPANTELMRISVTDPDPVLAAKAANDMADILITQGRELYTGRGKTAQEILGEQLAQIEQDISRARGDYEKLAAEKSNETERLTAARRLLELREATYGRLLDQYERTRANEAAQENAISIVEPAGVPASPSKPDKLLIFGLALLVGLVAGVGLAFLFENLDSTLYTTEKIEEVTQLPVLGQISTAEWQDPGVFFNSNSPQKEEFHRLRVTLLALDRDPPLKTLLLTSAEPGAGKSTIVANLAHVTAQIGRKVVVVDANMRRPTLDQIFDVPNEVGLSSVLRQKVDLYEAVRSSNMPGVQILTGGPIPLNPAELLGSSQMRDLLRQLAQAYDMVLLDAPALGTVSDAEELALAADGVLLVVGRAYSQENALRNACRQLATLKAKLIGVVVNRADGKTTTTTIRQRLDLIGNSIKRLPQRQDLGRLGFRRKHPLAQVRHEVMEPAPAPETASLPVQRDAEAAGPAPSQETASLLAQPDGEAAGPAPSREPANLLAQPDAEATGPVPSREMIGLPAHLGEQTTGPAPLRNMTDLPARPDAEPTSPASSQETASLPAQEDGETTEPAAPRKPVDLRARAGAKATYGGKKMGLKRISPKPSR